MNFYILSLIKIVIVVAVVMHVLAYLQWIERKVIAHVQLRVGPRRVGPHGLLQPLADVIKLMTKEGMIPSHVSHVFYLLAPFIAVAFALIPMSLIPFGPIIQVAGVKTGMELTDVNIAVLLILGITGLGVYGVALAGWSSNNKYALLGGLRSSAQMISYELPLALAIAAPLLILNTLSFRQIVDKQSFYYFGFVGGHFHFGAGALGIVPNWTIFHSPFPQIIAFLVFLTAGFAETNRVPFDLPEAENELVAGFHVEYASMKFASFFMAEYANMVTVSCVATLLFLGGWQPPFPAEYGSKFIPAAMFLGSALLCFYHGLNPARPLDRITLPIVGVISLIGAGVYLIPVAQTILLPLFWFGAKAGVILFVFIWIRATLPRFRYDQLMRFAWLFLFPLAMLNLFVTSLAVALTAK